MKNKIFLVFITGWQYDVLCILILILSFPGFLISTRLRAYLLNRSSYTKLIKQVKDGGEFPVFIFCSSIGELEQAMPLISRMEQRDIHYFIFFHSINGCKHARNIGLHNFILSPFDSFTGWYFVFKKCRPSACIINRHECWPGFVLNAVLSSRLFLINAVDKTRSNKPYVWWINWVYDHCRTVYFVNKPRKAKPNFIETGDSRIDRLIERSADEKSNIQALKDTLKKDGRKILVLGNAYNEDAFILNQMLSRDDTLKDVWKIIIIPARPAMADSIAFELKPHKQFVEINVSMGGLFHYYICADAAWIGGGFSKGIHNTLEASFKCPLILSGPNLDSQADAISLSKQKLLHICYHANDCIETLKKFDPIPIEQAEKNVNSPTDFIFNSIFLNL